MAGSEDAPLPLLDLEAVRAVDDLCAERADIPEWKGSVLVKRWRGDEKAAWEEAVFKTVKRPGQKVEVVTRKDVDVRAATAQLCVMREDGALMFSPGDREWLALKSSAALDRIWEVCARINRITPQDEAQMVEDEEEKNS